MSWSKDDSRGGRRGYHHGNLREALVAAALDLISQKGPAGVTFAEAARLAGVSTAAPYRHFRDRDALLADVARRGFERFGAALAAAWNDGQPTPAKAFEAVGRAYLEFARNEPAYFSAMFESGVPVPAYPELHKAAEEAFGVLRRASGSLSEKSSGATKPPAMMMALHIWAMAHGIAALFARGDAARRRIPMSPEELLEAGVLIYLGGLGIGEPPKK
jgi:AcrR family transcriptional regulator